MSGFVLNFISKYSFNSNNIFDGCSALSEITVNNDIVQKIASKLINISTTWKNKTTGKFYLSADDLKAITGTVTLVKAQYVAKFGDVNGDGEITSFDALMGLQYSIKKITLSSEQIRYADVNGDKDVTSFDSLLMLQYSIKKINKFPVE